jgi:hypothetical protein
LMSQAEAEKLGIQKSKLHYLRKRAKSGQRFRIYSKVKVCVPYVSLGYI